LTASIEVRHVASPLSAETPRYWNGRDPFLTHFMNALSSTFPDGEAFFVRSVHHYRNRAASDEERERIRRFGQQEGIHARQHAAHVELLEAQGYPWIPRVNRLADRMMRWSNRRMPRTSLATTAGLEHLTAVLARQLMAFPEKWVAPMHPDMARLWRWHALEEAEHKAVAFDLLARVSPSHLLRCAVLFAMTLGLLFEVWLRTAYFLAKDGLFFRPSVWWRGWRRLAAPGPARTALVRDYLAWYRRDFHPDQIDDAPLIAQTEAALRDEGFLAA